MINFQTLYLFLFIFSILTNIRLVTKFMSALLHNPPKKLDLSSRELFFQGLTLSYMITYIIKLFQ